MFATVVLIAFGSSQFATPCKANVCVNPRIRAANACGYVFDPSGAVIQGVKVGFDNGSVFWSTITDEHGYFKAQFVGRKVEILASAVGFQPARSVVESLVQSAQGCKKPIYVMLQIGGDGCTMISIKKSDLPIAKKE